jgi:hypothetical protein
LKDVLRIEAMVVSSIQTPANCTLIKLDPADEIVEFQAIKKKMMMVPSSKSWG